MPTANQYLSKAASYIGVSGTDNIFNTWYWGFHCYDGNQYPWCAAFQSYVANQVGLKCNKSASAAAFANQFKRVNDADVQPGDIVVFNWDGRNNIGWCDHVGVVEWFNHNTDMFGTIEGNTGSAAGGCVMRQTRNNNSSYFTAFFRPSWSSSSSPTTSTTSTSKTTISRKWDNGSKVKKPKKLNGQPLYNGMINFKWLDTMQGLVDSGGSGENFCGTMGIALQYLAANVGKFQVKGEVHGWYDVVDKYDLSDEENGCAGGGDAIVAVRIFSSKFMYRVHIKGYGWLGWMKGLKDDEDPTETEDFAGHKNLPIDAIQIKLAA